MSIEGFLCVLFAFFSVGRGGEEERGFGSMIEGL
jgi:hypothetical protein